MKPYSWPNCMQSGCSGKIITVRDIFTFFYLFPLRQLAAVLPPQVTRLISMPLIYIYSVLPVSRNRRDSISKTLSLVLGNSKTKEDIRALTGQSLRNAVHTFIDDILIRKLDRDALLKRGVVTGIENLEEALSQQNGVLLVGGHFTGDRLAKLLLREIGFPMISVRSRFPVNSEASQVEKKYFVPLMSKVLDDGLKESLYIEDKMFGIEILKRLRENGIVSILFDSVTTRKGMYCPFFGGQRFFPTNFLQIAKATGAALVPATFVGNSKSFKVIIGKKLDLQQLRDSEEFISANLSSLVKIFESQISQYPSEWMIL